MSVSDDQFRALLGRHIDGTATEEQFRQLNAALKESPERVREYVAMRDTETLLEWELGFTEISLSLPEMRKREKVKSWQPFAVAAGIVLAFLIGMQFGSGDRPVPKALPAAVLFDSEDAVWKEKSDTRSFGAPFRKGKTYQLESGIARLAFANGAGLAIEGPARMTVVNADRVEILEGKIAAYVPDEAVGFVVATPGMNIVDLGTKFGAEIRPDGGSEVHVFEGQVEVEQAGSDGKRLIEAGEGLRYQSGEPTSIPARESDFAEPPSLEQLLSIGRGKEAKSIKVIRPSVAKFGRATGLIAFENFAMPPGEIDGQTGAMGFGKNKWKAARVHTEIVRQTGQKEGGRLLIRGRQVSEPNVVNRLAIGLAEPLPAEFFVAMSGRYDGFDDDDFFGFWVDSADRQDSSHGDAPNMGIREGRFFARIGMEDTVIGPLAVDGETFTLVMKVEQNLAEGIGTVKIWYENFDGAPGGEVSGPCKWAAKELSHLGLRMGIATDVSDKLIVDRIAVGTHLEAVLIQP